MTTSLASSRPVEHRLRGIALRFGAVLCFAIMAGAAKRAADHGASTLEIIFYRNLFSMPVILAWLLAGPGLSAVRTQRPGAHLSRAAIGLVSTILNFSAIIMLPLAEATTIGFAAPLFATILSALVLSEPVGRHRWFAVAIGFVGVLVVMRPGESHLPAAGLIVAILAAMGVSAVVVTIRQIGATEPATATVFWFNVASLIVLSLPMLFVGRWHMPETWAMLLVVGVTGGLAQILMTASLRFASVATLASFDYFQLLWATLIGWLIWSMSPSPSTVAGGALIAASGLYTAWREHRLHRDTVAATPPSL